MTREGMTTALETLKIEVLISMTSLEITMTTEVKIFSTPDISVDNEVINIRSESGEVKDVLTAASFLVEGTSSESFVFVLEFIADVIKKSLPAYEVWLLVGSSAWQSDTRIVRYRGLWGALKFQGVEIPEATDLKDSTVEADGKLKFYGALPLSELPARTVVDTILAGYRCYVVALPSDAGADIALSIPWSGIPSEDLDYYCLISEVKGLLFKMVGEFDDPERGVISIGSPILVQELLGGVKE